ncbi:uncharacterized protein LOC117314903 [Pecten maximus]|uniref:uncharacterized protein LOC117314903 n=1 Tax=Pecten maximus TaxID=6579 RepID=UPI0014583DA6|nr:uncharacterized protein LOC117314903 [Pecten maximus]
MSSPGSSNGRGVAISSNNQHQNGKVWNSKGNTGNGFSKDKMSDGSMGMKNRQFNSGQNTHQLARFNNRNSGRFQNGQNIMQQTSHRGGGGGNPSFHVSSGMQSNIRRRNGGIPRGISNSGKRVVVQNGRRIIVSPSRFNMHRRRFQNTQQQQQQQPPRQRQIRIIGDPLDGGLENMDIDNIIGLASKIASVKLANSVLSSVNGQEGTPQLSRFLINSELDIVPEVIVTAPRQVIRAPRRRVTIKQQAPEVGQSRTPQTATTEIKVSPSGYGTPVLVRSGGVIQYSRVDQNGKEISSITISKGKQTNAVNNANTVKTNNKQGTGSGTGTGAGTGSGNAANGGTSKQAPEGELEMEIEEGVSTTITTIAASTKTSKPLLPPTTTVANSVILT